MIQLSDHELDRALRAHDPADQDLSSEQETRRDALLTTILATPWTDGGTAPSGAAPLRADAAGVRASSLSTATTHGALRRAESPDAADEVAARRSRKPVPRRGLRWLVPVAAAAAIGTAVWVAQPGPDAAFATWTPAPSTVSPDVLTTAQTACLDALADPPGGGPTGNFDADSTVLADQRGDFLLLSLASDDGSNAQCFFDANRPDRVQGTTGGIVDTDTPPLAPPAADEVEWMGAGMSSGEQGTYAFTTGRVGSNVAEVRIRTEGRTVTASLRDGHMAAWWPSEASTTPNVPMPPIAVDATLLDGTVLTDVNAEDRPGPREFGPVGGGGGVSESGEAVTTTSGPIGAEVQRVTVHVGDHTVEAEITQGGFVAEWPADTPGEVTYDLTYTDGTVARGAAPRE